jgi:uncharacterized protein YfaA (DUF2138 family)
MSEVDFTLTISDARFDNPTKVLALDGTDDSGSRVVVRVEPNSLGKIMEAVGHLSAARNETLAAGNLAGVHVPRGITIESIEGAVSMTFNLPEDDMASFVLPASPGISQVRLGEIGKQLERAISELFYPPHGP